MFVALVIQHMHITYNIVICGLSDHIFHYHLINGTNVGGRGDSNIKRVFILSTTLKQLSFNEELRWIVRYTIYTGLHAKYPLF